MKKPLGEQVGFFASPAGASCSPPGSSVRGPHFQNPDSGIRLHGLGVAAGEENDLRPSSAVEGHSLRLKDITDEAAAVGRLAYKSGQPRIDALAGAGLEMGGQLGGNRSTGPSSASGVGNHTSSARGCGILPVAARNGFIGKEDGGGAARRRSARWAAPLLSAIRLVTGPQITPNVAGTRSRYTDRARVGARRRSPASRQGPASRPGLAGLHPDIGDAVLGDAVGNPDGVRALDHILHGAKAAQ